jgi:hypothetical protein
MQWRFCSVVTMYCVANPGALRRSKNRHSDFLCRMLLLGHTMIPGVLMGRGGCGGVGCAEWGSVVDYIRRLSAVRSPTEFVELSNNRLRQQFESLSRQAQELASLAQGMTTATTDSIKSGVEKARSLS